MGCRASQNVKVQKNNDHFKVYDPRSGLSRWYEVCREGDATKLIKLLPFLTYDQLNRTEVNGSTSLHVACHRNHKIIVLVLLVCGCNRNKKNKLGLTPLEETKSDEIRSYFSWNSAMLLSLTDTIYKPLEDDIFAPNNKFIMGHVSLDHVYDAKEMIKMYRTVSVKMYTLLNMQSMSYPTLRRIVERCIPSTHKQYSKAIEYIDKENALGLIKLYTMETKFYGYLQGDNADFTGAIFLELAKFQNRAYKGRTYRGVTMAHFDVNAYKWAMKQTGRLIETQTFISTSELEQVAIHFACNPSPPENKVSVVFIVDFPERCDTALKLTKDESKKITEDLTELPQEKEVLVTPYTLFEVNSVDFDENTTWYRIHLTNVPIKV